MATTISLLGRQINMTRVHQLSALFFELAARAQEGTMVDIGSHKLNIVCTGPADSKPVVIFEAGRGSILCVMEGSAAGSACQHPRLCLRARPFGQERPRPSSPQNSFLN